MASWEDPLYQKNRAQLPAGTKPPNTSPALGVAARKPAGLPVRPESLHPSIPRLWPNWSPIGAAIAANCEPCFKYHYQKAQQFGVSKADMARAVETATAKVKDSPHQAILRLADRLTGSALSRPADASDPCCGSQGASKPQTGGKCCS